MGNNKKEDLVIVLAFIGKLIPLEYRNLIRSRWMRSYKTGNDYMKLAHPPAYYAAYNNYIAQVLCRPQTIVRIAVLDEDRDVALGFSVVEGDILHYVHVPKDYRRQGIGTILVPDGIKWFSHITKIGFQVWHKKAPKAIFNPFI